MDRIIIEVPRGISFMSNWKNYDLPTGHCIVDKGVTGCGYTEYCLVNDHPVVLCSPRKLLLENKLDQHEEDTNIIYLKNTIVDFKSLVEFKNKIIDHIICCKQENKVPKLLVTYDSCHYVIDALKEYKILDEFYFIIDEFQSIFLDSYFKASVEFDFVEYLDVCKNVLYLSATPMLDKYLVKIPEFQNLPFYFIDWKNTGIIENITIQRKFTNSLFTECKKIIENYLNDKFPVKATSDKKVVESKEAVFYFNSIAEIIKLIKKTKLTPNQVNIICADIQENKTKLDKLSKELEYSKENGFIIGKVPVKDKPNKMFTFCTKTAYIGADFYSKCASTFVFADPNIESLALDISLDLPQIAGRQRDKENIFKNNIVIFYKTTRKENMLSLESFKELQKQRKITSDSLLSLFEKGTETERNSLIMKIKDGIAQSQYSNDFISISKKTDEPIYNSFIDIANDRAWEVAQKDYQDKISVTRAFEKITKSIEEYSNEEEKLVSDFLIKFNNTGLFEERMRLYCEFMDNNKTNQEIYDLLHLKLSNNKFKDFYDFYGTSGCKALKYREGLLISGMINKMYESKLASVIYNKFEIGKKYTLKEIKIFLQCLYKDNNITTLPKATDLEKYFEVKACKISLDGKRDRGFEIIKKK
jgi:hypothetical protein